MVGVDMKKKRLDNAGYSLLEVIIVMAIIAIVSGFVFMGYRVLNTREVDECVKKLKMGLESNRVTTMGKLSANVSVYKDAQGYLVLKEAIYDDATNSYNYNTKRVGESNLTFKYKCTGDTTESAVPNEANMITVKFDRNSGALKAQQTSPTEKYIEYFLIELGSTKKKVKIEQLTGKVSVE